MKPMLFLPAVRVVFLAICVACSTKSPAISDNQLAIATATQATAIASQTSPPTYTPTITPTDTPTEPPTLTPTATPSPTPLPVKISVDNVGSVTRLKVIQIGKPQVQPGMYLDDFTPNGNLISFSGYSNQIMDTATKEMTKLGTASNLSIFSPDGIYLAVSKPDGKIEIWNLKDKQLSFTIDAGDWGNFTLAWSPDGTKLASSGSKLAIWDVPGGNLLGEFNNVVDRGDLTGFKTLNTIEWSPDGTQLAFVESGKVKIIEGEEVVELPIPNYVHNLDWSPDGQFLVTSSNSDPKVYIWRSSNWNLVGEIGNHMFRTDNAKYSPDGKYLATSGATGVLFLRDPKTGETQDYYSVQTDIRSFLWSLDGRLVALMIFDGEAQAYKIRVYDVVRKQIIPLPDDLINDIDNIFWFSDSDKLLVVNWDGDIQLVDLVEGTAQMSYTAPESGGSTVTFYTAAAYSPDGRLVAAGDQSGRISILDTETGRAVKVLTGLEGSISDISWSPDGSAIAACGDKEQYLIWDVSSGKQLQSVSTGSEYMACDWSPKGDLIATGHDDGKLVLWDARTGQAYRYVIYSDFFNPINDTEFSPDGKYLAIAGGTLRIWDVAKNQLIKTYTLGWMGKWIGTVKWSPDGSRIAIMHDLSETCSENGCKSQVRVLSFPDLRELAVLEVTDGWTIEWSPDGTMISSDWGEIWDASSGSLLFSDMDGCSNIWSPDGYYMLTFCGGLNFWGIAPLQSP
jgi:WD40 repeat protein